MQKMCYYERVLIRTVFSFEGIPQVIGDKGEEGPPVPIPNTEVKLACAEDTWRDAARENR